MSLKCRPGAALFSRRVRSTHFFILLGLIAITPTFARAHTNASLSFGAVWGFGSLEYDLRSPDTGSGVASRLDFPLDGLHPSLELTVARTEADHAFWSGTVSLSMNVAGPYGLMTDYDWNILSGIPPVPFSYTESPVSAVDFTARGALTWFPFHPGSADIGWQIGYSFQSIYQEIKGYSGWLYQWNSSTSSYDLYSQSGIGYRPYLSDLSPCCLHWPGLPPVALSASAPVGCSGFPWRGRFRFGRSPPSHQTLHGVGRRPGISSGYMAGLLLCREWSGRRPVSSLRGRERYGVQPLRPADADMVRLGGRR